MVGCGRGRGNFRGACQGRVRLPAVIWWKALHKMVMDGSNGWQGMGTLFPRL